MEDILQTYRGDSPQSLSPLVLAYVGDAVFEVLVRLDVLSGGNAPVHKLHQKARAQVNAAAQAALYHRIAGRLTETEQAVFRRGRNAKSHTVPKHAGLMDYREATGLEALFGYLYLSNQKERLIALYAAGKEAAHGGEAREEPH